MKNILITGGAGYIGSKISHDLLDRKYNVIIIDNLSTGHKKLIPNKSLFYQADFSNPEILKKIFKKFKIDTIIHLAASLSVEESMKNPEKYYLNNVFKTQKMLELISIYKIKKFIFSSTCAVYGENRSYKIDESGLIKPKSHYGLTKFLCESVIKNFSKNSSFKYYILRYFNVIGADYKLRCGAINNSGQLFKVIAKNIIKKNFKINVFGNNYLTKDGTCIRDYIDVNDLSNIHMSIIDKKKLNYNYKYTYN